MPGSNSEDDATELALALKLLIQRIRSASSEASEFSLAQIAVIKRLEAGGSATTADLARAQGMKAQSMGATVASLEALGMVRRRPHATDGRQMLVELTAKGRSMWERGRTARRTWLAEAIAKLDAKKQGQVRAMTGLIRRLAEL